MKAALLLCGVGLTGFSSTALGGFSALNMPRGPTSLSQDVYDLHMLVFWICVAIGVLVFGAIFYSIFAHRKSRGVKPAQFSHSTRLEVVWTVIPFVILIGMAVPATKVLLDMEDVSDFDLTVKVTGYQWMWHYEYMDGEPEGTEFYSAMDRDTRLARIRADGLTPRDVDNYLLEVDNPLVLPAGQRVRFLLTSNDVIHSWWVPEFGWKKDTIPGFVNEAWVQVDEPGVYRGQCAELCGRDHAFMPIVVVVKEEEDYLAWVEEQVNGAPGEAQLALPGVPEVPRPGETTVEGLLANLNDDTPRATVPEARGGER
ncbi:cytochrome c oxidase subunit 2 [Alkalispirillum mobile]|uniref:Cytochrome c oxidase subunit 2 n=1 Tax=Alkalispirillum mobile TaxID=85925 RepID=A0A498C6G1_9GAMM|nr:cytochrome c oxidase subunit II [Alkalispirillum mobile]RLK51465.1 cytochrome c oxidase subunit 2 [Alkalispirillum mobile]